MTEFQLKNYLKFMLKNIKENIFTMKCSGETLAYEFTIKGSEISIQSGDVLLTVCDIDNIIFNEDFFTIDFVEIEKWSEEQFVEKQTLANPELVRVYYILMGVMGKRAGFVLEDEQGNRYKGCYTSGKVLYLDEDSECVHFLITDLNSLKLKIVCITEVPGYLSFKSFVAEAERYAKCTNRAFRKYGKKEQAYA